MRKEEGAPLAENATRIEATYFFPFQAHAPLEPMNCTADVRDGKCTVWVSTQAPNDVQSGVAKLLGIDISNVTVHVLLAGGGFGRRLAWDYALEAAEASRAIGAPVQVVWTRADDMRHGHFQAAGVHAMSGAVADGKPVAWSHRKVAQVHNARERRATPEQMKDPVWLRGVSWGVYDVPWNIPSIETSYVPVQSPVTIGPWRAVFAPPSAFARECFFDELAQAANRDPLELRIELTRSDPPVFAAGELKIDRARLRRVLELVKEKSQWGKPLPPNTGRGVAANVYDGEIHVAYVTEVEVRDGAWRVKRVVAGVDCGLIVNRSGLEGQIESGIVWGISAMKGEITFRDGAAEQSSFGNFPVLMLDEMPRIEMHFAGTEAEAPFGIGEPPVPPIIPAVANAIFAVTGKRIRSLPVVL